MTTGDYLRQAILATPADDQLRLVYADWLEENGEIALADIIRFYVNRPEQIIDASGGLHWWHSELGKPVTITMAEPTVGVSFWMNRGFINRIHCSPNDWYQNYQRLLSRHPIELVHLSTTPSVQFYTDPVEGLSYSKLVGCPESKAIDHAQTEADVEPVGKLLNLNWPNIHFNFYVPWVA